MGFRGFTCHCATTPGKTISRVDSNQFCVTTGLRKQYNYCINFIIIIIIIINNGLISVHPWYGSSPDIKVK